MGRAYRDDEIGQHHHVEFTMLEWYRALEPISALMTDVQALVEIATGIKRKWTTLTVKEALEQFSRPTDDPDEIVACLVRDVEPKLEELGAVFITEYPAALASLAALHPERPDVSLRFEAYVDGIELANGFGELICHQEQKNRFVHDQELRRQLGRPVHDIDERFIDALAAGLPPTSGIALGFDRLLMLKTGAKHIDDVTLFPPEIS
jgi:lysyl-tRNA synthetase class 2